jgi:transcriptional regulator with XRE-family HTH domain
MTTTMPPVGTLLRRWRERRHMTQMDLALEAGVSTRHVSYLETGRSRPSRAMIERLAEQLAIPLRERNLLHVAAGFTPPHPERALDSEELGLARRAIDLVLRGHEPNPALAIDRHWNLLAANTAAMRFFDGVADELTHPPINVLRSTFHLKGLAPRIANFPEWRAHMLHRLRRQIATTGDPDLMALHGELTSLPAPANGSDAEDAGDASRFVVPFRLTTSSGVLSFLYTTTLFGSPRDVTLDELAIETFFPADQQTADALQRMQGREAAQTP